MKCLDCGENLLDGYERCTPCEIAWSRQRIAELEAELETNKAALDNLARKLTATETERDSETRWAKQYHDQWQEAEKKIAALEAELRRVQRVVSEVDAACIDAVLGQTEGGQ